MDTLLLVARLVLAATFLLAGVTKLADLTGSRKAMRDFGLPESIAGIAGTALPIVEIVVAILLIPVATAWWAALAALLLLIAFLAGIGYNLSQGRTPDCHCFGQVHSEPIGKATIARNGALAILAALVVFSGPSDPGASAVGWWTDLSTAGRVGTIVAIVALAAIAVQGWLLLQLLQQNGRLLLRLDALEAAQAGAPAAPQAGVGLPVGGLAPEFQLPDLDGADVSLAALRASGRPVMLLFTDPGCGPCTALMPEVGAWQRDHAASLTIAVVSRGDVEANIQKTRQHGITQVLRQDQREVAERFGVKATPGAVLIRPNGTIGSGPAVGADAIRALVTMAVTQPAAANGSNGQPPRPSAVPVGSPAPEITLPDVAGASRSLAEFRGKPSLLLFWSPSCGYCTRMLDRLKAWEQEAGPDAPQLLVISRGTEEANAAQGIQSPVLLDQEFATGRKYGSGGTPSAVLIDAEGNVASGIAVGADAVFDLANGEAARAR